MSIATILLKILLSFQAAYGDHESAEQREARMSIIADAVVDASEHATCSGVYEGDVGCEVIWHGDVAALEALLVTLAGFESNFSRRIHEGHCLPGECDSGHAKSLWQLHAGELVPMSVWSEIGAATTESTALAAYSAAKVLGYSADRCGGSIEGAISMYATGSTCHWAGAAKRARAFEKIKVRLSGDQP
jgi:hypothetical protein